MSENICQSLTLAQKFGASRHRYWNVTVFSCQLLLFTTLNSITAIQKWRSTWRNKGAQPWLKCLQNWNDMLTKMWVANEGFLTTCREASGWCMSVEKRVLWTDGQANKLERHWRTTHARCTGSGSQRWHCSHEKTKADLQRVTRSFWFYLEQPDRESSTVCAWKTSLEQICLESKLFTIPLIHRLLRPHAVYIASFL